MIIMPNQLPQPSVDNPLPWKAIPHTDNFGGTVVAKSGHVVTELDSSEDAKFVAASASAFYNLVERSEYMRGLVIKLLPLAEIAEKFADAHAVAIYAVCAMKGCNSSKVDAARAAIANLFREAREAIGEGEV